MRCQTKYVFQLQKHNKPNNKADTIENRTFGSCDSLQTLVIGDSVKSIGEDAFSSYGNWKTVTIGKSISNLIYDSSPFYNSNNIETLYYNATNISTDNYNGIF